jgi:hypothetical protein
MTKRHKLRGDSKFQRLPTAAQEELQHLVRNQAPLATLQKFCAEHGVEWSIGRLSVFAARLREKYERMDQGLAMRQELVGEFKQKLRASGINPDDALLDEMTQDYADALDARENAQTPESIELLNSVFDRVLARQSALTKGRIEQQKLTLKERDVAVTERKLALLEANAAKAKAELAKVAKAGGLTKETLQQIEAAAGLL